MMKELTSRHLVPESAYRPARHGVPVGPISYRQAASDADDSRLPTGASVLLILLSSLGLWAAIWAIVSSLY
jgi:hypothetical protein